MTSPLETIRQSEEELVEVDINRHQIEKVARAYEFDKKNNKPPALCGIKVIGTIVYKTQTIALLQSLIDDIKVREHTGDMRVAGYIDCQEDDIDRLTNLMNEV